MSEVDKLPESLRNAMDDLITVGINPSHMNDYDLQVAEDAARGKLAAEIQAYAQQRVQGAMKHAPKPAVEAMDVGDRLLALARLYDKPGKKLDGEFVAYEIRLVVANAQGAKP